ncbi:lipopolysaccharide biosynthesis protein [Agrobacterium sp. MA01]|uniref:lipopolysaccharide biosynthesis protein n=1 Tax=Agrobacterium sp. MA01 TaxID=2664893 RepID=UPI001890FB67|nr:oligosaccharide flippase family protein [Agrobacterium sp. MA01]
MSKSLKLNAAMAVGFRFLIKASNFLVFLIVARVLSQEEFGTYGYLLTLTLFFSTLFDFGARHSIGYYVGENANRSRSALWQTVSLNVVFFVIGALAFYLFTMTRFFEEIVPVEVWQILLLFAGQLSMRMVQGVPIGLKRMKLFNMIDALPRVVQLFLFSILLFFPSLISLSLVLIISSLTFFISAVFGYKVLFTATTELRSERVPLKDVLIRGGQYMPGALLMILLRQSTLFIVPLVSSSPQHVGALFAALRLSQIVTEVATAIGVAVFANSIGRHTTKEPAIEAMVMMRLMMLPLSVVAFTMVFTAPWIIPPLVGQEYREYVDVFRIMFIGALFSASWSILFPALTALRSPITSSYLLAFLPVTFILIYFMTTEYGAEGAAFAYAFTQGAITLSFIVYFWWRLGVSPIAK